MTGLGIYLSVGLFVAGWMDRNNPDHMNGAWLRLAYAAFYACMWPFHLAPIRGRWWR